MDMHESYNKRVPHVGYWHSSDVEPLGRTQARAITNTYVCVCDECVCVYVMSVCMCVYVCV